MCATSEKGTARSLVGLRERSNNHGIVAEVAREWVGGGGWKVEEKPWRCLLEAVGWKNFSDGGFWMVVDRSTNSAAPFHDARIYWTHACSSFLSCPLFSSFFFFFASSFPSFSVFLSAPVLNFLLFLSFFLSFFFSFYPIHRKFIEHHFPATFPTTKV